MMCLFKKRRIRKLNKQNSERRLSELEHEYYWGEIDKALLGVNK